MINVQYKCRCMKAERNVQCRERLADEDIKHWVEYMGTMIAADHGTQSPLCMSTTMEYAKIPMEDNKPIGTTPAYQKN